jgi:hypothetical protein
MDASATSAWVAAGIALAALPFNVSASRSARRQTELQSQIHRDSAQPYVWADIRGDEVTGQLVKLIVCNEGPTVATDVKVHFTPPLVSVGLPNDFEAIQGKLGSGFPSLPPGRRLIWNLAFGMKLFDESVNVPLRYHVAITGRGPFGPLPRLEYTLDLADMRGTAGAPQGSLHDVATAIGKLEKRTGTDD